jgi:hypothetical protein
MATPKAGEISLVLRPVVEYMYLPPYVVQEIGAVIIAARPARAHSCRGPRAVIIPENRTNLGKTCQRRDACQGEQHYVIIARPSAAPAVQPMIAGSLPKRRRQAAEMNERPTPFARRQVAHMEDATSEPYCAIVDRRPWRSAGPSGYIRLGDG